MALLKHLILVALFLVLTSLTFHVVNASTTQEPKPEPTKKPPLNPKTSFEPYHINTTTTNITNEAAGGHGPVNGMLLACMGALQDLQTCSIQYFQVVQLIFSGQAGSLVADCCRRVTSVIGNCGPLVAALGLSVKEGASVLPAFCAASTSPPAAPGPRSS